MTFAVQDRVFETSTTVGTGTYALAGAPTGFQAFSVLGANEYCTYFATDDTNWEVGIGQYIESPDRLSRITVLASSNADAEVDWGAGTKNIRCGLPATFGFPRRKTKAVGGSSNVTLTQDEMRCDILELTGVLTGNIEVRVDATPWKWASVFNNTTGAYTIRFLVTGQAGVIIPQGTRMPVYCNATDTVRSADSVDVARSTGQNFTGRSNATNPNYQVDFEADELVVKDSSGRAIILNDVDITADITASGANGLDTGSEASNTWYYLHVIYNPTTDTVAGLLSLSWTAPTLPSGYTFFAPVSAVRNNGSSNFVQYFQRGATCFYTVAPIVVENGTSTSSTAVDCSGQVPAVGLSLNVGVGYFQASASGGSVSINLELGVVSAASGQGVTAFCAYYIMGTSSTSTNGGAGKTMTFPNVSQQIFYRINVAAGTSVQVQLFVESFTLPIGGQ
jgi:hypothetical protein